MTSPPERKPEKPVLSKQDFDAAFDRMIPSDLRDVHLPHGEPAEAKSEVVAPAVPPPVPAQEASTAASGEGSESRPLPESEGFSTLYSELKLQEGGTRASKLLGYATGLRAFDDAIGGLRPSSVVVIAGPRGSGKTALAKQLLDETLALEPLLLGFYVTLADSPTLLRLKSLARMSRRGGEPLSLEQLARGEIPTGTVDRVASLLKSSSWVKREYVLSQVSAEPAALIKVIRAELHDCKMRGAILVIDDLPRFGARGSSRVNDEVLGHLVLDLAREVAKLELNVIATFPLESARDPGRDLPVALGELGSVAWNASTVLVLPPGGADQDAVVVKDRFGKTPRAVGIRFDRGRACFDSTDEGAAERMRARPAAVPPGLTHSPPSTLAADRLPAASPAQTAAAPAAPVPAIEDAPAARPRPAVTRGRSAIEVPAHLAEVLESGGASVTGHRDDDPRGRES